MIRLLLPAFRSAVAIVALMSVTTNACCLLKGEESPRLYLHNSTIAPLVDSPPADFLHEGVQVALVQFTGPVTRSWKQDAEASGVRLLRYLPDYGFSARGDAASFHRLSALPFVRWIGPYRPDYRVSAGLPLDGSVDALVQLFPGVDAAPFLKFSHAGGFVPRPVGAGLYRMTGQGVDLRRLAESDDVEWICPVQAPRAMMNHTRALLGATSVWNDLGLHGEGQIVGIVDTGLDSGVESTLSPDFAGRLAQAFPLTSSGGWADEHGHGTHVAGAIAGGGSGPVLDPESLAGVAPRSRLVVQALHIGPTGIEEGLPDNLENLFSQAYSAGARIHNDSWGDDFSPYGSYSLHSSQVDDFVWKHPDLLIVFAAGNDGVDSPNVGATPRDAHGSRHGTGGGVVLPGSLYAPGTAKNSISVGASEGDRPPGQSWGGFSEYSWRSWGFYAPPISTDPTSDHPNGMAPFSSRGPTRDGRLKPDLTAPGTNIVSTLSSRGSSGNLWGIYDRAPTYAFNGGSSIASGVVSGAAALARQYFVDRHKIEPSAALVKATLLNGAYDLTPGQYGTGQLQEIPERPNIVEGWGRVDVGMALAPPAPLKVGFVDRRHGFETGDGATWLLEVKQAGLPLRVMLAWSDYPAAPEAGVALVNDLDLIVTTPDGDVHPGNGHVDRRNNVEAVNLASADLGVYRISIHARNIPYGPQPFALTTLGAGDALIRWGDLTGDGEVSIKDVVRALQALVGLVRLTDLERRAADVSPRSGPDGVLTASDVTDLLRAAIGIASLGPPNSTSPI